jgi:iron complex outermembrane receptor protein
MKRNFFCLFLLYSSFALAQTDTVDLTPVEVRSVRAGTTAPFTKTNIGKAAIEKNNLGQDLPFILNTTPSVVVYSDAGNGVGYTGLRIRGTDASRINVTLNGVPFNDPESGGAFFVDLPDFISSVNSLQVQRGVGTSSNGAGAFGATINVSTAETAAKPYLEANNSIGSFGTVKNTVRAASGLLGKHFTTDLRLSRISSNGYIDRASTRLRSLFFSTAYTNEKSSVRFNLFTGREKTYQAWYGVSEADLKTNRRVNYAGTERPGSPYPNETDNYLQTHYQLFFNRKLFQNLMLHTGVFLVRGKGYYEQYKASEDFTSYGLPYPVQGNDTIFTTDLTRQLWLDNYFYGSLFSLQYQQGKTGITFGGAATKYDGCHYGTITWMEKGVHGAQRWYDLDATKPDVNLYAKWQQNISPSLQTFADIQWRYVQHRINGFRYNPTLFLNNQYHFFNPKLGLSYTKNNWFLYTSYSIAHKEPNRDDFEAGITEQPRPEKLHDLEMGLQKKSVVTAFGATLYYMKYTDQLVLTGKLNDVGAYTRTNIKNSYRLGVELEGSAVLKKWLRLSGNLALSRNRIKNFSEYLDDYDNGGQKINRYAETAISFSPAAVGSAVIALFPAKKLEVNLVTKYVGKQYLDNTQNESRALDAFATQDLKALYSWSYKHFKNIMLIAQVANIFNTLYEPNGYTFSYFSNNAVATENYYYPAAGINWSVGLNVRF